MSNKVLQIASGWFDRRRSPRATPDQLTRIQEMLDFLREEAPDRSATKS